LFGTEPAKRKPGYANFAVADPPLKLVLFEAPGATEKLNHLGVEVESSAEVTAAQQRVEAQGLEAKDDSGTCCYAEQDKVWVSGAGESWEIYKVLADSDTFACAPEACG
jgi:hypothetical protein